MNFFEIANHENSSRKKGNCKGNAHIKMKMK